MRKLSFFTAQLIVSTIFIIGCGGESNINNEVTPKNSAPVTPPPLIQTSEAAETKNKTLSLLGVQGNRKIQIQRVSGLSKPKKAIVDAEFSNANGSFVYKDSITSAVGNLHFSVNVEEPDQIVDVSLFLPDVQKSIVLCAADCGTSFNKTITGFNPQLSGIKAGNLRVELFVTDNEQNTAKLDALNINWQPINISAINATRENGVLTINWEGESPLGRYNVYAATEPNVTPNNTLSLENGIQQLAITATQIELEDKDQTANYYVLITAINEGGESGLYVPLKIASSLIVANQPPHAVTDIIEVDEDSFFVANLIDNDIDPENQIITINAIVAQPTHGVLSNQTLSNITYTPNANFVGNDSFTYEIIDDANNTSQASVSITINNVNDSPIAVNDSYNLEIDNTLTTRQGALIANDSDIDGDFIFVEITPIAPPLHGTLQLNADGSFTYIDDGSFSGNDSFQYQITDNKGGTSIATVTLLSSGKVTTPLAVNDAYQIDEDKTLTVTLVNGILANDTDPNNLDFSLRNTLIQTTTNGLLNLASDGSLTYIPNTNYNGNDSFQYEIENSLGDTSQAFVTITVNAIADIPSANNDSYQVNEDTQLTVNATQGLLANDSDNNATLTVNLTPVVTTQQGTLSLSADGSFTYLPDTNFSGVDTFTYQILNSEGNTNTGVVNIAINSINDAPKAVNDTSNTVSDTAITINAIANDIDIDGDNLTIIAASTAPKNGTVISQSNQLLFTPSTTFSGVAIINYTIVDTLDAQSSATVSVSVSSASSPNVDPITADDAFSVNEGRILNGASFITNDTDPEGAELSALTTPITDVTNGVLVISSDGTFIYTPNNNFNGTDSFIYSVTDGDGGFNNGQVTITVNEVNQPPTAGNDTYSTQENTAITVIASDFNALLKNDSDSDGDVLTINVSASGNTSSGTLSLSADGEFTYTPNNNFSGSDSFNYQVEDDNGGIASGLVTITVVNVNVAPLAVSDTYNMLEGTTLNASSVLTNDIDTDNDTLKIDTSFSSLPSNGTVSFSTEGTFVYTPNTGFFGTDTFAYKVDDGNGAQDEGLVIITILPDSTLHTKPLAKNDNYSVNEGTTLLAFTLLNNDISDQLNIEDVTPLTVTTTPIQSPNNGKLRLQSNGSFDYTPNPNYFGSDSFEYEITNIYNETDTARVNIVINAINDAPTAVDDRFKVEKNSGKYTVNFLLDNDSDPDGDHLDINEIPIVGVQHGTLTLTKHGDITYTPDTDYVGTDSFVYQLTDSAGNTDFATVTITIIDTVAGNLPPTAVNDIYSTKRNKRIKNQKFILNNDVDRENDKLELNTKAVISPKHGSLSMKKNGQITYEPDYNYVGTDTFVYKVQEKHNSKNFDTATVTITITK